MGRIPPLLPLVLLAALPFAASAHPYVEPAQAVADRQTLFTLVEPADDAPIEAVTLKAPAGFQVNFVESMAGWTLSVEKSGDAITGATWTAATPLPLGQVEGFHFVATPPSSAGALQWTVTEKTTEGGGTENPAVTVVSQDPLEKAQADLQATRTALSQLQQSYSRLSTSNAEAVAAASGVSTPAYAALGLAVVALLIAVVPLLRKKA